MTSNQENNQILLNAIRNKFASGHGESESVSFSPPKFNIPILKNSGNTPKMAPNQTDATHLNKLLLNQINANLQSTTAADGADTGFMLPKLRMPAHVNETNNSTFILPLLKTNAVQTAACSISNDSAGCSTATSINFLSNDLQSKLHLQEVEDNKTNNLTRQHAIIDLTTALTNSQVHGAPATAKNKPKPLEEDFHIPFIECDGINPPDANHMLDALYCQLDVSQMQWQHSFATPSNCGRIFCEQSSNAAATAGCISKSLRCRNTVRHKVKHQIKRFNFDTQSPDDKVLASLSKYQKVR